MKTLESDALVRNGKAGNLLGRLLAPFADLGSWARGVRILHPRGMVYQAEVVPLAKAGTTGELAQRLRGEAMVRLSGAWWRGNREWKDVLGCAVRFLPKGGDDAEDRGGEQDLLFATVRKPWTTLLAPFTTDAHDFLENDYYAVSPFEVAGVGRVKWRLITHRARTGGRNRWHKLERAVMQDLAAFRLELFHLDQDRGWEPVAEIRLKERMTIDQETLRFSPFLNGRGIEPRGLIHGLRLATYRASQRARPRREEPR